MGNLRTATAIGAAIGVALAAPAGAAASSPPPVLVLDAAGHVRVHADPLIGPADPPSPSARQAPSPRPARPPAPSGRARTAAARRSVPQALDALLRAGAIDLPTRDIWLAGFTGAKRTAARLRGTRTTQLAAVIDNVRGLAADGLLSRSRAPLAFLTLARNRAWWANAPLLGYGQRVGFDGSELVWQYYPGQGIEVQWLGTFGKANGLVKQRTRPDRLRALLDEALALAAARAGGIAWEGLFGFGGGRPPWASALTQGTAVQALTRAAAQLAEPRYLEGARAALGLFETRPPQGVRVATPVGAHYLQYSFAPGLRILNGFIQSLNGLNELAVTGADPRAPALFAAGDAEARIEAPTFDTGAWSLYSRPGRESDLGYHTLLRDFLRSLCQRVTAPPVAQTGGTPAGDTPAVYCALADRFTADLTRPPAIVLSTRRARQRVAAPVRFSIDKVSTVTMTLRRAGEVVYQRSERVGYGRRGFLLRPRRRGPLAATLRAVDLAGNATVATGTIEVLKAK